MMAPNMTAAYAGKDGWLSMLLACALGVLCNLLLLYLLSKYQYSSIFDIAEQIAGKIGGTLFTILFLFITLHLTALVLRNFSNFMTTVLLPEVRPDSFEIMMVILVIFSVSKGVQNIARINEIIAPLMIIFILLTLILVSNNLESENILPVLDQGWHAIFHGAYPVFGFPFIEMIVFTAFLPFVADKTWLKTYYLFALTIAGLLLSAAILVTIGVEGESIAKREVYSAYSMARSIELGTLFQRVEAFIGIVWMVALFVKITVCFLSVQFCLSHLSRSGDYYSFLFPTGLLVWTMSSHLHHDLIDFTEFVAKNWTLYWLSLYIIIILLLFIGLLFGKHKRLPKPKKSA